jgi:hypothetical protein
MRLLPTSHRKRRRLAYAGAAAGVAGAIALAILLIPRGNTLPSRFSSSAAQTVRRRKQVPLTRADRREIDRTLDRFVPAAVGRHDPGTAWAYAAADLRRGTTREDWNRGDIPVPPYPVHSGPTHSWVLLYSYRNLAGLELGLRPKPHAKVGNAAFFVTMRHERGHWRVASIALRAVYPP